MPHRRFVRTLVVGLTAVSMACSSPADGIDDANAADGADGASSATAPAPPSDVAPLTFYRPPTVLADGTPGDVLDRAPLTIGSDLPATGERITYISTTPAGDLVPVTGVLLKPLTAPPPGGYPVAVWGHGTTGLGDACAPSTFTPFELTGGAELLAAGIAVAAPDYEGLGTDEIHPYLVGEAAGHNVLDAARAASSIGGGRTVVAWGHSQGGHAVLFARMVAAHYAPELDLRGVAAVAPVTDPKLFLLPGTTDPEVFPYLAEAAMAWSVVYEEPALTDLVDEQAASNARLLVQSCAGGIANTPTRPLDEIFLADPANQPAWNAAAARNTPAPGTSEVPVLLAHGDADPLVPIAGTEALARSMCSAGVPVEVMRDPTWDHATAWLLTVQAVDAWLHDRLAGDPAPTSCSEPAPATPTGR